MKVLILIIPLQLLIISCSNKLSNSQKFYEDLKGVQIGKQVWANKNLDVATFRNGDTIFQARSKEEWVTTVQEHKPAWCYYLNDSSIGKTYGRMYNWYAVNDPRGLSPKGWHVPTNNEWIEIESYLGVPEAGIRLKEDSIWISHKINTDSIGIRLGGYRGREGGFTGLEEFIYLASATESDSPDSRNEGHGIWGRGIHRDNKTLMRCVLDKEFGLYVRCVKD